MLGCFGAKQILIWMQTPKEVLHLAALYLRIYFLGMTATMVYNFGSAIPCVQWATPNGHCIICLGGSSQCYLKSALCHRISLGCGRSCHGNRDFTVHFRRSGASVSDQRKGAIRLEIRQLHIHKDKFLGILKIGLPAGVQGIIFSLSNVVIQSSINSFGAVTVAGNSAAANIESFVYFAMNAFHQATISFTGQNMGAGNYKRSIRL